MRLINSEGKNVGIISKKEALRHAADAGLDLIEITKNVNPPVVRIADQGKYQYDQNKLKKKWMKQDKERGKKSRESTKQLQIKPGTGQDTLTLRANKIRKWLDNGNRVKVDIFLFGRYKGMDEKFLKGKLTDFIETIPGEVHILEPIGKSSKGYSITLQMKEK